MKWLSIFLAVSLTASEKLDRTYLPPPGAQFAGGNPDEILTPLELPNLPQTGSIPVGYSLNSFKEAKEPLIKSPITTTSYAFTQTTTFPSIESYATTPIPINPTIGLPVENLGLNSNFFYNQNLPSILQQDDSYSVNILPGSISQNQNQNIVPTEGDILIPSSKFQQPFLNSGFQQYPSDQLDKEKLSQYLDLNIGHPNPSQENFTPQGQNIEIHNQGVSTKTVPQSNTHPLHNLNTPLTPYNQDHQSYSNGEMPQKQFLSEVQSTLSPVQLGKTHFKELGQDYSDVPSTKSLISSKLPSSDIGSVKYFERPQAASDRSAVILNYENVLTPNSYSYSYDTSNGIHADESGVVGDGTKAKGSYSYMSDDGKIYSIFYTADENGFQPHGDHLPTPPPIPEAIKRVIEQAARDKEAGIIDDGSYDENKYGHKNYYNPINHRGSQGSKSENNKIGLTSGATSNVYNKNQTLSQFPEYQDIGNKNNLYKNDYKDEKYKGDNSEAISGLNKGNVIDGETSHDISGYINAIDFKNPQHSDSENKNIEINQVNHFANQEQPRSGQAFPKDGFSDITNIMQDIKLSPVNNGLTVNNKFEEKNLPNDDQEFINGNGNINNNNQINSPDFTDESKYISDRPPNQKINEKLDQNGYHYNHPENQKFTSRFRVENTSSTTEPKYVTFNKNTIPLSINPEVRIEPTNIIQYSNRKSTTPRPFMTSRVTTIPRGGPYSDYDNEDELDIEEENITSNKLPSKIINNDARHPLQSSETVTPSIPTTSYSSRFANTEIPQNNAISQEAQKHTSKSPESLNNFGNNKTSSYMYQTTRPSFGIETTNAPHYSSHVEDKDGAYNPQITREYGPQEHVTSTFKPATTTTQTPSVYQPDYFRPSQLHSTRNGYQYQPIRSGYNVRPQTPERLDAEFNPNYYQRPVDYTGATNGPKIRYETTSPKYASTAVFSPQSQGSFINSGLPETHVSDSPFTGYVYGPPQIVYPTTASTIGNTPDSVISSQPLQPNRISQEFSTTTQSPTHSSIQNTYDHNTVVDGFGRPIKSGTQLIVSSPDQKDDRFTGTQFSPKDGLKSFDGTSIGSSALPEGDRPNYAIEQSSRYPEYNNQAKVIGENFSGPKQPQTFDPQTGYHYK